MDGRGKVVALDLIEMAHSIHGIITSFKYDGALPNIILVGNYHLIPLSNNFSSSYSELTLEPYRKLTKETRKVLKELSFKGKCAYIETDYFGGPGIQLAEAWHHGERTIGPLISFDGMPNPKVPKGATMVEDAINETLRSIGVYRHEGKDEFDSVRLGWYRSNDKIIEEFNAQSNQT